MYDPFEEINKLPILDLLDDLGIGYTKNGNGYILKHPDGRKDTSFSISVSKNIVTDFGGSGIKGPVVDFIGQYHLKIQEAEMRTTVGRAKTVKFFIDKGYITPPNTQVEFKPSLKDAELLSRFDEFKLNGYKQEISSFLITRGVDYDWIQKNSLKVGEVFSNIGYYDNYYCTEFPSTQIDGEWVENPDDKPKSVGVFLFPCFLLDKEGNKELVGLKIRRKDGKTIRGKKSLAVREPAKTGLFWDKLDPGKGRALLVEGEMDAIILRLLGFDNVVANQGGVQSHRLAIKSLLSDYSTIICLYDNDGPGNKGKIALQETLGRPLYAIDYPVREDTKGRTLTDVNDYYKVGYDNHNKWATLLKDKKEVGEEIIKKGATDFIFLRSTLEYYDTRFKKIQQTGPVAAFLGDSAKELAQKVATSVIHQYDDLCYLEGGDPGNYNTMNESVIVKHGGDEEPILHEHIEYLIDNICNNRKVNSRWLHKAILYKLTHINDVYVPAVILYGTGRSGKGSFINLLSKIFGSENTMIGLGQRDLEGQFDSYTGDKLIVEYKEIVSGNKFEDKKILDKLKGIICEKDITVNAKHQKVREVKNIAWFHLSSNHPVPIQLDSKHSGNKRFTIIKTGGALSIKKAREMNEVTFKNKKIIKQYVSRLFEAFPEVPNYTSMEALENPEKLELENNCEGVANLFFEWFEEKFPNIWKISLKEKEYLLNRYGADTGENIHDTRYKQANFNMGLSHRYEGKRVRIRNKTKRGYWINKSEFDKERIPAECTGEFIEGELYKIDNGITF